MTEMEPVNGTVDKEQWEVFRKTWLEMATPFQRFLHKWFGVYAFTEQDFQEAVLTKRIVYAIVDWLPYVQFQFPNEEVGGIDPSALIAKARFTIDETITRANQWASVSGRRFRSVYHGLPIFTAPKPEPPKLELIQGGQDVDFSPPNQEA